MAAPFPAATAAPILISTRAPTTSLSGAAIVADAVPGETHDRRNTITDHPVETGYNPSDHSRPEPDRVSIEFYASDWPATVDQMQRAQRFMQQAGIGTVLTPPGLGGQSQVAAVPGYSRAVRDRLDQYRLQGTTLTLVTMIRTYSSMMIEGINEQRGAADAFAFHAQITFKFISVVDNKLTRRTVSKDTRVGAKAKGGSTTPKPVEQSVLDSRYEKAAGKSGLAAIGAFTGLF